MSCFQFFQTRLKVKDWKEIKAKIISLHRLSFACRSRATVRQLNEAYRKKKKDSKTVTQALNEFTMTTSLANYRLCVQCEQYFLNSSAIEVKTTDPQYAELNLIEKESMKIMNSFWLCLVCKSSSKKHTQSEATSIMKLIEVDGKRIWYPSSEVNDENMEINIDDLVLFPKRITEGKYEKNWSVKLYNNQEITNKFISTLYKIRVERFAARKIFADLYNGEILQQNNKKLQSI